MPQSAPDFILHHYDTSPFSEKARVMFGIKGLAWGSVIQPVIMPKPELIPLTGGYRRIPVMQIGADVYCDTQVIMAEIEARAPTPRLVRGGDWAVNIWADRLFFQATVAVVFGEIGDNVPAEFVKDREKLSGRPFDTAGMKAAAVPMKAQWRSHAAWIEAGLADQDFLGGSTPSLADVAAYMNVWWLSGAAHGAAEALLAAFPKVRAWKGRMRGVGHGQRRDMTGAEALAVARAADPVAPPPHDDTDPLGLQPGAAVAVAADDYGRDPIEGRLVAPTPDRVVIGRESADLGRLNIHFPRIGYTIARA
ncbi:glutathione S-transferase family protein [Phenylobacterium soli]|uniref:Glutathione S-transferase family protein n=1 Tax=Phenylobacterium soli TaxID=2170551 RepID=A0A328AMU1_9CAUL|nr:glutathione S-transferase family protein [Phenylobacterium soli]RAK55857.1 glutathione S-transferase family protein [Phenylobacterium soli]